MLIFDSDRTSKAVAQDADIVVVPGKTTGPHETRLFFECVEFVASSQVLVLPVINMNIRADDEGMQRVLATLDNSPMPTRPAMIISRSIEMDEAEDYFQTVQEMYPDFTAAHEIRALFDVLMAQKPRDQIS